MPVTMIEQYEVMYSANAFAPRIWLKGGGKYIGQLVFKPDGAALPPDSATSLYYHLEDFENALNLSSRTRSPCTCSSRVAGRVMRTG